MKDFIRLSKYAGMREDLVQAGGGNSSYKISNNRMIIKASGCRLADVNEKRGFTVVDQQVIKNIFINKDSFTQIDESEIEKILNKALVSGNHPSIETFLHAISGKYTLHTHPIVVNAMVCRADGMQQLSRLFPKALMVSYATPGFKLAEAYFRAAKEYCKQAGQEKIPDVVFLQNHGLVVSGDNASMVINKTEEVLSIIEDYLGVDMSAYHMSTTLAEYFENKIIWRVTDVHVLETFRKMGLWKHAFCPDCVVYLGKRVLNLPSGFTKKDIEDFKKKYMDPVIICYESNMYLVAESVCKAMEIQSVMSFSAQVAAINTGVECCYLSDREQNFLLNWNAEKYRRSIE